MFTYSAVLEKKKIILQKVTLTLVALWSLDWKGLRMKPKSQLRGNCNNSENKVIRALDQGIELKKGYGYVPKAIVLHNYINTVSEFFLVRLFVTHL